MDIIHILASGQTLCGMKFGRDWPEGHKWTSINNKEPATCAKCREAADLPVRSNNYLEHIDSVYAVLSMDEGGEGIVGAPIGPDGSMIPLIAADVARLKDFTIIAKVLATKIGWRMKIVKFTMREDIEEIQP